MAKTRQYRPGRVNFGNAESLSEDALMIYDGQPVTLRDYRTLMSYERHVSIWQHLTLAIWRWAERKTYSTRKREAARLMKRIGVANASVHQGGTDG